MQIMIAVDTAALFVVTITILSFIKENPNAPDLGIRGTKSMVIAATICATMTFCNVFFAIITSLK